jgi:hypothetical protein
MHVVLFLENVEWNHLGTLAGCLVGAWPQCTVAQAIESFPWRSRITR